MFLHVNLRSKLARLDGKGRTASVGALGAPGGAPAEDARPTEPTDLEPAANDKVAELRARLSQLITHSRERAAQRAETRRAEVEARLRAAPLPFDEEDTPLGPLHARRVVHPGSHVVGRVPIRLGFEAHAEPLSLLSLDPSLGAAPPKGALYIDTEATGLAGGTGTIPFLVGLAWFEPSGELIVEQLLLRRLGDEAPMLVRVADRIAQASMLVSFNGKAFDWPLLRTRFVMNRLTIPGERPHLDLVHVARRVHRAARGRGGAGDPRSGPTMERWREGEELERATSCKLTALERQVLGFVRVDDVPSAEVPARYSHFLRSGDADAILSVCDHNLWDVVSMVALVGVYADAVRALDANDERELPALGGRDMVGLARTLRRAGDAPRARKAADVAVEAAAADAALRPLAHRTRGVIAKGAEDNATALADFAVLADEHDDRQARLELAKLYEHKLRDPRRALAEAMLGTDEPDEAAARRRARLERKVEAPPRARPSRGPDGQLELGASPPSKLRRT
jgi:uncharacterized protein YprB with RNaseH-like and TPR domain